MNGAQAVPSTITNIKAKISRTNTKGMSTSRDDFEKRKRNKSSINELFIVVSHYVSVENNVFNNDIRYLVPRML